MKRQYIIAISMAALAVPACTEPVVPEAEPKAVLEAGLWSESTDVVIRDDVQEQEYYKDAFMDSGVYLTSRKRLPSCEKYNISMDIFNGENSVEADSIAQIEIFAGNELDHNGVLLYPDGAPRFKVLYTCGGKSGSHGGILGEAGRNAVRDFFNAGGSYSGSYAGAFIASIGAGDSVDNNYYSIWPGHTTSSGLSGSYTGMFIEPGSPLLNYFDFGGDMYIDSVRHDGGCYCNDLVPGTEVLARYDRPDHTIHNMPSIWAWKDSKGTGRVVVCGSDPEEIKNGERCDLTAAFLMYAMDGRGVARVKKVLANGEVHTADKDSRDHDPLNAKIGDGQQHHFAVAIPTKAKNIKVRLEYEGNYEIHLLLKKDSFAFEEIAEYKDDSVAGKKEISLESLEYGTWYIGVHNVSRPGVGVGPNGLCQYTGQTELLNGIPYTLSVSWE